MDRKTGANRGVNNQGRTVPRESLLDFPQRLDGSERRERDQHDKQNILDQLLSSFFPPQATKIPHLSSFKSPLAPCDVLTLRNQEGGNKYSNSGRAYRYGQDAVDQAVLFPFLPTSEFAE
jgi:hypothetical protein